MVGFKLLPTASCPFSNPTSHAWTTGTVGLGLGDAAHTGPLTSESHVPCSSQGWLAVRRQEDAPVLLLS